MQRRYHRWLMIPAFLAACAVWYVRSSSAAGPAGEPGTHPPAQIDDAPQSPAVTPMFSEKEITYIKSQRLARIATVSKRQQPDVAPVSFEFDGEFFYRGTWPAILRQKNLGVCDESLHHQKF